MTAALTNPGADPRVHFKAIGIGERVGSRGVGSLGVKEHTGSELEGIYSHRTESRFHRLDWGEKLDSKVEEVRALSPASIWRNEYFMKF